MRAAFLEAPKQLVIRETDDPVAPAGGLVINVKAALTCGTDLKTYLRGHPKIPLPSPLGHEFSGVIDAIGEGVTEFAVGDQVMAVHSAPCNECFYCAQGLHNLCETIMDTKVLGAFADKIALPAHITSQNVFPLPVELSFEKAAFLEPLACVTHGLRVAGAEVGETAAVIGAGPIGLLFTAMLAAEGCAVFVVEPHEARREAALTMGAHQAFDPEDDPLQQIREITGGHGVDLVVECTGNEKVWQQAVGYVRRGGRVLLFGGPPADSEACFSTARLHYDQIALLGCFHFAPRDVAQAADLLSSGALDPTPLITDTVSLEDLPETFEKLAKGEGIKVVVEP